ncbi:MAG: UDP-N-acetylglucosamine 2-epimerase (non-hydrolyzing) [Deltaproteobacteria bacterium HGW-Deltaproteobacteria-15]|jgi:UDP-GlcNAc3NAcA epimerase|nr:MAG: UDP-N-acetylglucosamine 2-epimerase (non-hydrolyzing) [Deltaproteobacteria bacterium HGW-Deltaproteobacteria-15]
MKLVTIVGARPQFVKAAAVSRAIVARNESLGASAIQEFLLHTGQHYDEVMSGVFFRDLELPEPNEHLGVGSGPQGWQTGRMLTGIEETLLRERPDWVLIYGDTNSTLAGALAAVKLHIPLAHVEAGLRSFNRRMAEEHNRVVSDHLSTLLLCPTRTAVENLRREGIDGAGSASVENVGDVMYDSILHYTGVAEKRSDVLDRLKLNPGNYGLVTIHRAENTDDPVRLKNIFRGLEQIAREGLPIVLPLHPRTRKMIGENSAFAGSRPPFTLTDPVPYLDMLLLEKSAKVILTDSGGVQKEAYWLGVPCVTMRDDTEWVETVEAGWNLLVGADPDKIVAAAHSARPGKPRGNYYGNGHAAEQVLQSILKFV